MHNAGTNIPRWISQNDSTRARAWAVTGPVPVVDEQSCQPWKLRRLAIAGQLCEHRTNYRRLSDIANNWSSQTDWMRKSGGRRARRPKARLSSSIWQSLSCAAIGRSRDCGPQHISTQTRISAVAHRSVNSVDTKERALVGNFCGQFCKDGRGARTNSCPKNPQDYVTL